MKSPVAITGVSLGEQGFLLRETRRSIDAVSVLQVLRGELAAYRILEFLPSDMCSTIVENFWSSPRKVPRLGYGKDGVEGYFIGASHIEKKTQAYLEEARAFEDAVDSLYIGAVNPIRLFRETFILRNEKYKSGRPACSNGLLAGDSKAVYWNSTGDFLLSPHDDFAQLSDPEQSGFEIQQATRVMAVNFYAVVPKNAGQLKIWNIEPDEQSRTKLGLRYSGFPYPAELLDDFESIVIPVEAGDLCVINGNLIHAVMRGDFSAAPEKRLLITCFMTFNDKAELIWWT